MTSHATFRVVFWFSFQNCHSELTKKGDIFKSSRICWLSSPLPLIIVSIGSHYIQQLYWHQVSAVNLTLTLDPESQSSRRAHQSHTSDHGGRSQERGEEGQWDEHPWQQLRGGRRHFLRGLRRHPEETSECQPTKCVVYCEIVET